MNNFIMSREQLLRVEEGPGEQGVNEQREENVQVGQGGVGGDELGEVGWVREEENHVSNQLVEEPHPEEPSQPSPQSDFNQTIPVPNSVLTQPLPVDPNPDPQAQTPFPGPLPPTDTPTQQPDPVDPLDPLTQNKQGRRIQDISSIKKEHPADENQQPVGEFKDQIDINLEEEGGDQRVQRQDIKEEDGDDVQQQSNNEQRFGDDPVRQIEHLIHSQPPLPTFGIKPVSLSPSSSSVPNPYLQLLFNHYSKISYTTGKNMTFDRLQHQTHILNINKFMILCKDLKLTKLLSVNKLMNIFKRSGASHLELSFSEFVTGMKEIAEKGFKGEERMRQLQEYVGIESEERFRGLCSELHIHYLKVGGGGKSNIRLRTRRFESKHESRLKSQGGGNDPNVEKWEEGRQESRGGEVPRMMKAVSNNLVRTKIQSQVQKQPTDQSRIQSYSHLRNINKSVNVRSSVPQKNSPLGEREVEFHSRQIHRYSRRNQSDNYQLNPVINKAREQISSETIKQKGVLGGIKLGEYLNIKKKEERENESFLNNLIGENEDQDDEFLDRFEREGMRLRRRKEAVGISRRLEEVRMREGGRERMRRLNGVGDGL